jgi:apolipoprotein N-acyltransferase
LWPSLLGGAAGSAAGRVAYVAVAAAVVVVAVGAGPLAYAARTDFAPQRSLTVALVQSGRYRPDSVQDAATAKLTASASRDGKLAGAQPDLIVWGESSETNDLARDRGELRKIEALSRADGAEILVNQDSQVPDKGKQKVALLIGPGGVRGDYVKTRLVPFGEYIPLRRQLGWLTRISKAAPTNTVSGNGPKVLIARDRAGRPLPIGVLICWESAFPDMSRTDALGGAQLLVYQSSTATFQGTWGPDQHAALAAVRAAETGRPAVQAALTGVSVAFDGRGRQLAWLDQSGRGVVTVPLELPAPSARTPYDRYGDYVPWTATGVAAAAMAWFAMRARRQRR